MKKIVVVLVGLFMIQFALASPLTGVVKQEDPEQLFDITFNIDESVMVSSKDLTSTTTFESFGTEATPVNLKYFILDEYQKVIYQTETDIVVETEYVVKQNFEDAGLDFGKYILLLETTYSDNVKDRFYKEFEVRKKISQSLFQLFDIKMDLDDNTLVRGEDLSLGLLFESFGSEPTPISLEFSIIDSKGNVLQNFEDHTVVETEKTLKKKISSICLNPGKYSVILNTKYNVNVEDEFKRTFTVQESMKDLYFLWASLMLNIILISIIAYLLKTRRKI